MWETAFGLQKTDNLKSSEYMIELSYENINGIIDYKEIEQKINEYYTNEVKEFLPYRSEEANISSLRIVELLSKPGFRLSVSTLLNYHKSLFNDIESFNYPVGEFRDVNISKEESILNGKTVVYKDYTRIFDYLNYDFEHEAQFNYKGFI